MQEFSFVGEEDAGDFSTNFQADKKAGKYANIC